MDINTGLIQAKMAVWGNKILVLVITGLPTYYFIEAMNV